MFVKSQSGSLVNLNIYGRIDRVEVTDADVERRFRVDAVNPGSNGFIVLANKMTKAEADDYMGALEALLMAFDPAILREEVESMGLTLAKAQALA